MSVVGTPEEDDYFPLSAAQMNIYFAQKLNPQVPFTIAQYVEIRGDIDPALLIRATDIACRELESPGVRLVEIDGRPYQQYDGNVPYAMIYRDLRDHRDPVGHALEYMDEQYRKPVDLVRDQLIASEIMQVGDAHYFWYSRAHHVVMDGLGAISVQERTAAAYTALLNGTDIPKTRAVGVREIYDYETAYPNSSRYETDRAYWMGRLDGHADAPRLAGSGHAVASDVTVSVGAVLDAEISAAMAELARRYNSSDVPVVLATFALYLARMTGTDDVMLSLPVSGRATTKLRDSSGMMSNIVPLRIGVDPDVTVEELLRRIQVELTGALRHQRFRVEDMQRGEGAATSAGRGAFGPTVNIMMYNSTIRLGEVIGEYRVLSSGPIDDMMVNVYPGVAGTSTRVDFLGNPAVYSVDELRVHHERFLTLLRTVVAAPDGLLLADLGILDSAEEAVLLREESTGTVAPALLPTLLHPEAVVRSAGVELSAHELNSYAGRVAAQLVARGAGDEARVAVALDRSLWSVLALWSVTVAGASFVPVDPHDPTDRLTAMLRDTGVRFGIADRARMSSLPSSVEWIAIEDLLDEQSYGFQAPELHVDNEAYVIHTSGSTGKPKAVSVTHRGLAQMAASVVDRYSVSTTSRVLHLASPVFDASLQEILGAFAAGATLVVAPADVYAGPALADLLAREQITHLITSPSVLATLTPTDLAYVEVFDVGGEACPPALRDRFAVGRAAMLNAYGPTETTVLTTLSEPMTVGERIDIGAPLPGVRALVLDARLRPVPSGGIGELYLGGDGLARGYVGRSATTASRFVADPAVPGRRLYRTGDLVRWSIDGSAPEGPALEYLGRSDQQVQVHGRRIELGEIESVALQSAGVRSAAVTARDDRLVAYVTGTSAGLDAHFRRLLPAWMVPDRILELQSLPTTASGKLDRAALPSPATDDRTEYAPPQTDTERAVAAVFSDVLGVADVGREHTFFELGGDSLSATRVVARLGAKVSLPVLFDTPTVAAVAAAIDAAVEPVASRDLLATIVPDPVPLSYTQQRMWFLNQFDAASPAYNMPVAVRLPVGGDPAFVVKALRDVLERHESLRTYFPDDGDGPHQVVVPTASVLTDVSTRTIAADELDDAIAALASTGFDVAADVPIRAAVLTVESTGDVVIVVVMHHISVDGWSIDPLVRDITVAFTARTEGHAPTWSRLPAQYSNYAVWNRAVVDAVADEQLAYWTSTLGAQGAVAELPLDHPRPPVQSLVTADVPFEFAADLHERIRRVALLTNATPFMIVHAALAVTLGRFSGSSRTVVGTPSAGRGHEALDDMVGMFVGTVPLTVDLDLDAGFIDLVAAVRSADLGAFAHSELPFERIVDALATDRSLDRHPIFQVMLAFDNAHHESVSSLPITVLPLATHTSEFDLNLVLTDSSDGIDGHLEYAVDLYERATVELFAAAFVSVLETVVADPSVVVGDIELGAVAITPAEAPVGTLLDVLVSGDVAIDGDTTLTYYELDSRSNRLARLLIAHGAGPEVTVALSLERSAQYIVDLWAVAKAGAAFLPVDPSYPAHRRAQILAGTELGFGGSETGVRWFDESEAQSYSDAPITDADRTAALLPGHPAYVIHTSGSTGTPKPVTVTHAAVFALAQQVVPRYDVNPHSRVLHGYSVNFDAAVLELVLAFGAGATMVILPSKLVDGDDVARFLSEHAVSHYLSTPALLATVAPIDSVTTVAVGGDVLDAAVVAEWAPGRRMLNAYGPSEATVVATLTEPLTSRVDIGRPLDHVHAHILDRRLREVPVGGVGELYLGGVGLARGYGSRAALTAERFVAGPQGQRLYRTGDLVRADASGTLDYRGRIDSQVQMRGVRIELGDIEAALVAHPAVRAAVARLRENRIVAWVVGAEERDLREWLLARLPLAMMPSAIVSLDRIPVTTNGKIDDAALVAPGPVSGDPAVARTLAENVIAGIFADILGLDQPSADANFFVLGGDSLSATRAVSRIGAALSTHIPVRTLFESPTPHQLAVAVDMLSGEYTSPTPLVHRADSRAHSLLSPAERRVWLQNRFDPTSAAYNLAFALPVPAEVDLGVLRAAIIDVLDRHIPLRTVYPSTADGPVATLLAADAVVSTLENRHVDVDALASQGFDLTVEPPVRIVVVQSGGERQLVVVAHHIAVDGLSLAPLARDMDVALTARRAGLVPEFTLLAVDYADYRLWQHDVLDVVAENQLDYWRGALAGLPEYLELPSGTPNPHGDASPIPFDIDADTLADLRGLAHRLGATVFVVVHAALAAVLAEASGTQDIAIGTPVSGRSEPDLDDLVGMFVGTIVLRTPVTPSLTFEQFVTEVRNRDLDAFAHSTVPFDWVVEAVEPTRSVDSHPLFQVLLAVGAIEAPPFQLGVGTVGTDGTTPRRIDITDAQLDLEVVLDEGADGLVGHLGYSATRFERSVCEQLADRLVAVLQLVAARPDVELGSIEFLGGAREVLVHTAGATGHYTLGDLVRHSAQQWPDAIAVIDGTTELTYADLDRRSDELLPSMLEAGARPGTLVAVALPRSADFVAAVWAVAKSGAGYLPIDPTQPASRIDDILTHAQPVTVITAESWADSAVGSAHARPVVASADNVAYVIYTSGSTGAPKGVRVTNRGIADLVQSQRDLFDVDTSSRVLQFASPGFDASLFEMLLAFGAGAAVVIAPPEVYAGRELETFVTAAGVTHMCLTPTVLQFTDPAATPSVEVVIMAGEAANSELLQRWSRGTTGVEPAERPEDTRAVFNAYGPTETTIMATCTPARSNPGTVTIGGPVRGFDAVVLDARLRPVPDNVVGELYLGGSGLAEGYLGQPGLTAGRFVPNLLGDAGGRLYRTGDLVRWVDRGRVRELEYLGRVDSQVKIRGHRVELAEVEAALLRHPEVSQACVVGHGNSLAAYYAGAADARGVRDFLARTVPSYMVPGTVTAVETVPMTMSGKVDVSRLPAPSVQSAAHVEPSTPLEYLVRASFADVLELDADSIGVDDNFFDLGGHSLSVVRVMDALGAELGRPVPITSLLTYPTVAALAATLDTAADDTVFDVLLPLRAQGDTQGVQPPLFCVHPAIGIAWSYVSLLGATDRPLYGLQVPGIADGEESPTSIDAFAARYVREIRAVQPTGPYHLLGWSLGGVIAHAIATALQSAGEEVAFVALVDAQLSSPLEAREFGVEDLARQLGVTGTTFDEITLHLQSARSELAFLTSDHLRRMYAPVTAAPGWVAAHRPKLFDGDVVYFAARGSLGAQQWEQYTGGRVVVRRIDAAHEDMLGEAGARVLGREIGIASIAEGVA